MFKIILDIEGMACGMCEAHINDAIRSHFSVKKLKSSWKKGTSEFFSEEEIPEETIRGVIEPTGYRVTGYHSETARKGFGFF